MLLADLVLIIHFLYVLFVVGSLPVIWLGAWLKLAFVRNPWFRYLHLAAICLVVAESLIGIVCRDICVVIFFHVWFLRITTARRTADQII